MSDLRQALLGILAALACAFIILGSLALALAESRQPVAQAPTSTQTSLPINTPLPGQPTFTPSPTSMPSSTPTPLDISTCPQPAGWQRYDILPGDTLASLAQAYGTTVEELRRNNCDVLDAYLGPGVYVFVPPLPIIETPTPTSTSSPTETTKPRKPTATRQPIVCSGPPSGWVIYVIKRGDTLFSISHATGTTVADLKLFNCLSSDVIHPGDSLYVPHLPPTRTLVPTSAPTRTRVPTAPPPTTVPPPTEPPPTEPPPNQPPTTVPTPSPYPPPG